MANHVSENEVREEKKTRKKIPQNPKTEWEKNEKEKIKKIAQKITIPQM